MASPTVVWKEVNRVLKAIGAFNNVVEYQLIDRSTEEIIGRIKVKFCGKKRILIEEIDVISCDKCVMDSIRGKIEKTFEGYQVLNKSIDTI